MAQSQLALYNLALSACSVNITVSAVDEESYPAETCQLWYDLVRQVALRAAHWNSARRYARLVIEATRDETVDWTSSDPAPGYAYSYALPSGLLAARYLTTFETFELSYDNDKRILNTNAGSDVSTERPILAYTADVEDPSLWEPDLYQAIVYGLAASICLPLTGKLARSEMNIQLANGLLLQARANNANEYRVMFQQQPANLQARGYEYGMTAPFIYPYGSLYTATGAPTL